MPVRKDDIIDLINRAERASGSRNPKVKQTWHGQVAAHLSDAAIVAEVLAGRFRSRTITDISHGDNWVAFRMEWTAKGVNAADAEKFVKQLAANRGSTVYEVAVDTNRVVPVPPVAAETE